MPHFVESLEPRRLMALTVPGAGDAVAAGMDHFTAPLDTGGHVTHSPNVLVQRSGRIVVAGMHDGKWALRRYMPNGKADKTFGDEGLVKNLGVRDGRIVLLAEASDGGFFVVGRGFFKGEDRAGRDDRDLLVAKLKSNGDVNKSFRPDGVDRLRAGFIRVRTTGDFDVDDDEVLSVVSSGRRIASADHGGLRGWLGSGSPATTTDWLAGMGSSYGFPTAYGPMPLPAGAHAAALAAGKYAYAFGALQEDDPVAYFFAGSEVYLVSLGTNGVISAVRVPPPENTSGQAPQSFHMSPFAREGIVDATPRVVAAGSADQFGNETASADEGAEQRLAPGDDAAFVITAGGDSPTELGVRPPLDDRAASTPASRDEPDRSEPDRSEPAIARSIELDRPSNARVARQVKFSAVRVVAGPVSRGTSDTVDADAPRVVQAGEPTAGGDALVGKAALQFLAPTETSLLPRAASTVTRGRAAPPVRYRAAPVTSVAETEASVGRYDARELGKRVADVTGALAIGRTLGTFAVRVPEPILTTSTMATGMTRERQQRLAPNT